jgi:hypothetical protein
MSASASRPSGVPSGDWGGLSLPKSWTSYCRGCSTCARCKLLSARNEICSRSCPLEVTALMVDAAAALPTGARRIARCSAGCGANVVSDARTAAFATLKRRQPGRSSRYRPAPASRSEPPLEPAAPVADDGVTLLTEPGGRKVLGRFRCEYSHWDLLFATRKLRQPGRPCVAAGPGIAIGAPH